MRLEGGAQQNRWARSLPAGVEGREGCWTLTDAKLPGPRRRRHAQVGPPPGLQCPWLRGICSESRSIWQRCLWRMEKEQTRCRQAVGPASAGTHRAASLPRAGRRCLGHRSPPSPSPSPPPSPCAQAVLCWPGRGPNRRAGECGDAGAANCVSCRGAPGMGSWATSRPATCSLQPAEIAGAVRRLAAASKTLCAPGQRHPEHGSLCGRDAFRRRVTVSAPPIARRVENDSRPNREGSAAHGSFCAPRNTTFSSLSRLLCFSEADPALCAPSPHADFHVPALHINGRACPVEASVNTIVFYHRRRTCQPLRQPPPPPHTRSCLSQTFDAHGRSRDLCLPSHLLFQAAPLLSFTNNPQPQGNLLLPGKLCVAATNHIRLWASLCFRGELINRAFAPRPRSLDAATTSTSPRPWPIGCELQALRGSQHRHSTEITRAGPSTPSRSLSQRCRTAPINPRFPASSSRRPLLHLLTRGPT